MTPGRQSLITTLINMASSFLLNCNYSVEKLDRIIPLFYWELLAELLDLLNNQGNYLSPQEFSGKYNIKVNFLQYTKSPQLFPLTCISKIMNQLIWTVGIWIQFAKTSISNYLKIQYITLNWKKTFCKQFYKHFVEEIKIEPTAIKSWWKNCPEVANNWVNCIQNIYKIKLIS